MINTDGFVQANEILANVEDLIANRKIRHVLLTTRKSVTTIEIQKMVHTLQAAQYKLMGMWGPQDGDSEAPKPDNPEDQILSRMQEVQSLTFLWSAPQ